MDSPPPPISQESANLSKKNGKKLVGYTFRQKNYVKIPQLLSNFSELAPPLCPLYRVGNCKEVVFNDHMNFRTQVSVRCMEVSIV